MCYYPKRIFLDDLCLFRVGSGGEKENGEKNRRAFALGKGFDADAFVFLLVFVVFRREKVLEYGRGESGKDRRLTAVFTKNHLATISFSCLVR